MKKVFTLIVVVICHSFYAQTQSTPKKNDGIISGNIIDFKTKKSLQYVNIVCKDKTTKIISGGITDSKGRFKIANLPLDSIFVDIQFMGYKTLKKRIFLSKDSPNLTFINISLQEEINQLEQVNIETETSTFEKKIDRIIINVGKDLASTGSNSLQMLDNIPLVHVDYQSGSINLRGNNNVRVLIDGKPSNLSSSDILKQIPSSSVNKVELITNPSAKYNPEGMSGIINIILKKDKVIGFNGTVNFGAEHSINTRPSGSFDFNYRVNKFNFYGNYGIDFGKFETFSFFNRLDKNLNQDLNFLDNSTNHFAKIGVDFYINDKNTLSFYTNQSLTNTDFYVDNKSYLDDNLIFDSENISIFKTKEITYNLDYKLNLSENDEYIEFEVNYTKSTDPQEDTISENLDTTNKEYNYNNFISDNNSIFLANLDYSKPINNGLLEIGLESRFLKAYNAINTDQEINSTQNSSTIPVGNSKLNYDRDIYSAYINVSKEYNKISFQTGLRLEQFNLNGIFSNTQQLNLEPITDKIFKIYPSAFITYNPSEKNQFQISYSRRVDRPGIDQITPIQEWNSPLSISIGNRNLVPQFTNSFELNYTKTIKNGYLSFGTFYRKTSNVIGKIINIDATNLDRQILSYTNYESAESYGIEFSSRFRPFNWWTLRPSTNLYFQDNQGFINNSLEVANNTLFTARVSNSLKATKKLRFTLSASYRGNSKNILSEIDDYFLVNVAARYTVFNGNGAITIRGTDIFDGYKIDFTTTNPFTQVGQFTLEYNSIYLGFSYNFGKGKNRERDRKYREENETEGSMGVN
ncbi:TonB-dependent receptor domain-containing protein [Polaribacter sp. Asnod6-C07]|uniref:TonB-dependent receptor domain-containing protein n=1 Tax=Polaribacter sp. Asnod6-C07 TaxID=3160582 RepID=UPI00386A388A